MRQRIVSRFRTAIVTVLLLAPTAIPAQSISFQTPGATEDVADALRGASLVLAAKSAGNTAAQDLFAAARAEYARLLGTLYAQGHYSGVISIRIDGREAAEIPLLDSPDSIRSIAIDVRPGPQFRFAAARMRPYAPGTEIPPEYGDTKVARSTAIEAAAVAGVDGWRAVGNAKARVEDQDIVADHANASLRSLILLEPGPKLRFGDLSLAGYKRMRPDRLAEIAGFPTGRVFNPDDLAAVERRLRRSGVFRTIALTEAEIPNPDGTLDISLLVEEEALRRFGFGAEIASFEGLSVNGFWLHRNLLGGGERLRFDAAAGGIEGQSGGIDYDVSVRFERPATFSADNTLFSEARAERIDDADFDADRFEIGIGMTRFFGERLEAEVKLSYVESHVDDGGGSIDYRQIALPAKLSYDRRDVALDATEGYFAMAEIKPFLGFGSTGDGVRLFGDGRIYRGFGTDDGVVLAARLQVGTVTGPTLLGTPREDLFYSGGGGTVRGQPYQSLGVRLLRGGSVGSGGQSFVGASGEVRFDVSERIGLVGFADIGGVSPLDFFSGGVEWHSGAGIGVRYATPIGPIRLDVAAPVSGTTGDGVQIYIGIGQSF